MKKEVEMNVGKKEAAMRKARVAKASGKAQPKAAPVPMPNLTLLERHGDIEKGAMVYIRGRGHEKFVVWRLYKDKGGVRIDYLDDGASRRVADINDVSREPFPGQEGGGRKMAREEKAEFVSLAEAGKAAEVLKSKGITQVYNGGTLSRNVQALKLVLVDGLSISAAAKKMESSNGPIRRAVNHSMEASGLKKESEAFTRTLAEKTTARKPAAKKTAAKGGAGPRKPVARKPAAKKAVKK
jgi:hypothetical protein